MKLAPEAEARVKSALRDVETKAKAAKLSPDLDAAKRALNALWFAIHDATQTINNAERETRQAALRNLGEPA